MPRCRCHPGASHLVALSALKVSQFLQHASLRQVLACHCIDNWHAFLHALRLGESEAQVKDAALFLESMIEAEPALLSQVELVEGLSVERVGCGACRVICSAEVVHRVVAPLVPADLQSLLQMDFSCLADEIEVSCPQCFAATATPRPEPFDPVRRTGPSGWLTFCQEYGSCAVADCVALWQVLGGMCCCLLRSTGE